MSANAVKVEPESGTRLHLLLCLGADFDVAYIPHLCRHYVHSVHSWNVLLHSSDPGEHGDRMIDEARRTIESGLLEAGADAPLRTCDWRGEFNSLGKVNRLNDMTLQLVPPGDWVLHVDADEFIDSPGDIKPLLEHCTAIRQKVVYGQMVDRFADGREPLPIGSNDDLFVRFPHGEEYTKTALLGSTHKPCLMRYEGTPLLINCHDYAGQTWQDYRQTGQPIPTIWHFKWVESTREKLKQRVASFQRQGLGWWRESARCLRDIYHEASPGSGQATGPEQAHPYNDLTARAFWKSSFVVGAYPDLWRPKWQLLADDRVVTFGSCFARHLGPALRARGFTWWETEPPPLYLTPQNAQRFGYGNFSCRTSTITTTMALRQWVSWAMGDEEPPDEYWSEDDRILDPFRPSIEPGGFISADEMMASRKQAINSLERAILEADVFHFTLGMTECWVHHSGGWVYPACPGTAGGCFDPGKHRFLNLSFDEIRDSLCEVLERLWAARPGLKILLAVSPVPMTATASGQHVLTANAYSKATLRAAVAEVAGSHPAVDYFPAYEIVTAPAFGEWLYEPNRRSVSPRAVARVMDAFCAALDVEHPAASETSSPVNSAAADNGDDASAEAFK